MAVAASTAVMGWTRRPAADRRKRYLPARDQRNLIVRAAIAALALASTAAHSAPPDYRVTVIEPPRVLAAPAALSLGDFQKEIPPVIVGGPPQRYLFGGIESFACTGYWSLLGGRPGPTACTQVLGPVVDNREIRRSFDEASRDEEHFPSTIDPRIQHVQVLIKYFGPPDR